MFRLFLLAKAKNINFLVKSGINDEKDRESDENLPLPLLCQGLGGFRKRVQKSDYILTKVGSLSPPSSGGPSLKMRGIPHLFS